MARDVTRSTVPELPRDMSQDTMPLISDSRQLINHRRDILLRAIPIVLLVSGLAAAVATSWGSRQSLGLRNSRLGQLQVKDSAEYLQCGTLEQDTDFPDGNIQSVLDVKSAEACGEVCEQEKECMAWTWGSWKVCYLKSLWEGDAAHPATQSREGAVSAVSKRGCEAVMERRYEAHEGRKGSSDPSLFCFSYVKDGSSGELELLATQADKKVGIFECEDHAVYSQDKLRLGSGLYTTPVGGQANAEFDMETSSLLKSRWGGVAAAWQRMFAEGHFQLHPWTVKVDPEAVFLPSRLRPLLKEHPEFESSKGAYLNNCQLGLRKSFEVLSRNAMMALGLGQGDCAKRLENLKYLCPGGHCVANEDKFLEQCLFDVLGVEHKDHPEILADEQCMPPAGWWSCQDAKAVAFSPFRTVEEYHKCRESAMGSYGFTLAHEIAKQQQFLPLGQRKINTTTTTRTKTTTTTTSERDPFSLYCFSVMMPRGMELSLVRNQLAQGVSIFACDRWAVYSSEEVWLSPGPPEISAANLSLDFRPKQHVAGALTATWLNTENFIKAWDAVIQDGHFWESSWAVKVDPDAVFFPDRLRSDLRKLETGGEAVYLKNCNQTFGFYGALEVVSRKAVGAYSWGKERCMHQMGDHHLMGEDMFMKKCFDFLGIREVTDYDVLDDGYCGGKIPCTSGRAAFHPLKSWDQYNLCLQQAQAAPPPDLQQKVVFKQ